mgnify:CR=1 FL=1
MKPATAKSKGRETENTVVEYLRKWVPLVERRRLQGVLDQGDISGWANVCVEVKSGAKLSVPQWLRELAVEKVNAKARLGFLAVRLNGKSRAEDFVVMMPLPEFMDLLEEAGYVPRLEDGDGTQERAVPV